MKAADLPNNAWNAPGIVDAAKKLYDEGNSYGRIARELSQEYKLTITANAVNGKLHRIGHVQIGQKDSRQMPKKKIIFIQPRREAVVPVIKATKPMAPIRGEKQIEYIGPIGTTPAWGFCQFTRDDVLTKKDLDGLPAWQMCGHPAEVKGKGRAAVTLPWCRDHAHICYSPPQAQKRSADAA